MKSVSKEQKLRMTPDTYYVWVGGSCDYGHEERCGFMTLLLMGKAFE